MTDVSPQSPEVRAERIAEGDTEAANPLETVRRQRTPMEVLKRVVVGVYSDGFIHAGNFAYLSLLTLFPFFIVATAVAQIFGRGEDGERTVRSFLHTLPPNVADLLRQPIADVLHARTGALLWLGAIVGLWTVGSFVETIRDIMRRAYGVPTRHPFWHYRLGSVLIIVSAVVLAMISFVVQGAIVAAELFIYRLIPRLGEFTPLLRLTRLVPGVILFGAIYILFYALTPTKYRYSPALKWPGALFVAFWWLSVTALLPLVLTQLGGYDRTYGSLAGVIIALFFFWLVGFGIVIGAHLNAALAETDLPAVKGPPTGAGGRSA